MSLLEYIFWLFLITIVYIYIGYPFIVFILSKLFGREIRKRHYEPFVSIIIAAYNEEKVIGQTIENKLALNYPKNKMEVIIVSDGSIDGTDNIIKKYSGTNVRLIRQESRSGKTAALNSAVPEARGEYLVFSDANSIYGTDALLHLMKNFNDPEVGYVTGKMIYTNPDGTAIGDGCSAYMKYENFLRKYETKIGSVVGVDGGIDAVRKSLYQSMQPDQLPDFVLPLRVVEQGYHVVYEPDAILREQALKSTKDEYKMRVRVTLRSLWALYNMNNLFNLFKYGLFSWQLISHKALRYLVFIFVLGLYLSNAFLLHLNFFYKLTFLFQNAFFLCSYLGYITEKNGKSITLLYIPYYFSLINYAAGYAFLQFLKGKKQTIWNPRIG